MTKEFASIKSFEIKQVSSDLYSRQAADHSVNIQVDGKNIHRYMHATEGMFRVLKR